MNSIGNFTILGILLYDVNQTKEKQVKRDGWIKGF